MIRAVLTRLGFIVAVALTTAWVVVVGAYLHHLGWAGLDSLEPPELAALLAAAGGPPVALWLIVAVLEQRRSLNQLVGRLAEVMAMTRHSLQQAESQTRVLLQLQAEASRGSRADSQRLALHDLAANAAVVAERLGVLSREAGAGAWARYGAGDVTVFVQSFLNFAASHPDIAERMADAVSRDAVARAALAGFVRRYQRLAAALVDDAMAREVLEEGALGRGYRLFKTADELANTTMPDAEPEETAVRRPPRGADLFDDEGDADEALREPVTPEV